VIVVCLDLEGVLVPEIWIEVARRTRVDALTRTTRDEPDYDKLMRYRLDILAREKLRLADIEAVIAEMAPLEGATGFLAELRERHQVIVLSDTFYEFARPLMRQLGWPTLLCHRLESDAEGRVTGYRLRQQDPKRQAVLALQALNYRVIAAGDSYNDTTMLGQADAGILFSPPDNVVAEFPQFPVTRDYDQLRDAFLTASERY
jgi:phosphoserine/homoserine phosphotransferase